MYFKIGKAYLKKEGKNLMKGVIVEERWGS
jgi:hypothetical protein